MTVNRYHDGFPGRIEGFSFETLETDPNTIFALSEDMALIYCNPAWFEFARANGGEPAISERFGLGTGLASVLDNEIRDYYLGGYLYSLETGEAWHHDYECSSAHLYRSYRQTAFPFHDRSGLLLVNSLIEARAHDPVTRRPAPPAWENYLNKDTGLITQCLNCRRTQRVTGAGQWDWVPAWVEKMPPEVSTGVCALCYEFFWSPEDR